MEILWNHHASDGLEEWLHRTENRGRDYLSMPKFQIVYVN